MAWLGIFELMDYSDILVVYDDVQFDKNGWRNRNRIKTPNGIQWFTVAVLTRGKNFHRNNDVMIKKDSWQKNINARLSRIIKN